MNEGYQGNRGERYEGNRTCPFMGWTCPLWFVEPEKGRLPDLD
jgi:hypothetical protein